jgi:hypothetical protein
MKIKWYFFLFGSFTHHFQNKLSTHGLDINFRFVSMSEVELFFPEEVIIENSNTMEFEIFCGKT